MTEDAEGLAEERDDMFGVQRRGTTEIRDRADTPHLNRKTNQPICKHADAVDHEIHHHGMVGILGPTQAGLHNGKPRLHEHDKKPCDERPNEIDGDFILAYLIYQVSNRRSFFRVGHRDVACCAGERTVRVAFGPGVSTWHRSASDIGIGDRLRHRRGCCRRSLRQTKRRPTTKHRKTQCE